MINLAIRGGFTTKSQVYLPSAYINIPIITLSKQIIQGVGVFVGNMRALVYKDEEAYRSGAKIADEFDVSFELDENATIAWAYMLLKTRNIIENPEDC